MFTLHTLSLRIALIANAEKVAIVVRCTVWITIKVYGFNPHWGAVMHQYNCGA